MFRFWHAGLSPQKLIHTLELVFLSESLSGIVFLCLSLRGSFLAKLGLVSSIPLKLWREATLSTLLKCSAFQKHLAIESVCESTIRLINCNYRCDANAIQLRKMVAHVFMSNQWRGALKYFHTTSIGPVRSKTTVPTDQYFPIVIDGKEKSRNWKNSGKAGDHF